MYKILIVEEDIRCREHLARTDWALFSFEDAVFAGSYAEGLNAALQLQPHVVLVGMTLGERQGSDFAARLRAMGCRGICCLMASHADSQGMHQAMRSGCRDILKRPPNYAALKEFLEWAVAGELHEAKQEALDMHQEQDPVLGREYAGFGRITGRILQVVHSDYRAPISLISIAKRFNMSSKYIGRVFLQETGLRFTEYLMAYRMLEAKRLILSTSEKISVIAGMVGYSQQNNFYTHFHRYFGVSPSSLRGGQVIKEDKHEITV